MQPLQTAVLKHFDRPVAIAFGFIVVLLPAGSLYSSRFLSANYLLPQLQVTEVLVLIASGAMLVLLLGHFDLSYPCLVPTGAMPSPRPAGPWGQPWAAPSCL